MYGKRCYRALNLFVCHICNSHMTEILFSSRQMTQMLFHLLKPKLKSNVLLNLRIDFVYFFCMGNWCIEIVSVRFTWWWVCSKSDHSKPLVAVCSTSGWRGEGLWLPAVAGSGMLSPGVRLGWAPLENVRCCGERDRENDVLTQRRKQSRIFTSEYMLCGNDGLSAWENENIGLWCAREQ